MMYEFLVQRPPVAEQPVSMWMVVVLVHRATSSRGQSGLTPQLMGLSI